MAIELADDRRDQLLRTLQGLFLEDQAVQDVRRHLQTRLDDVAGEVFASEVF